MGKLGKFAAACAAVICAFGAEATVLPAGYQEVEWIESTAKQSIDLGFKCVKEKTGLVMRFNSGKYQSETAYFGTGWSGNCYLFCQQGSRYRFYASSVDLASSLNANCDMTITIVPRGNGNGDITLECPSGTGWTTSRKENISLSPSGNNLQVFGIGNKNRSAFRLYRLTITERTVTKDETGADVVTQEVVHDFVPCYRVEDNVIGLYDICAADAASAFKADTVKEQAFLQGDNVYYEDKLVVSAAPIACGTVTPAYGTYGEHVAGTSYTLTAPASWTSEDGLARATCSACAVTAIDGEVVASETFSGEGDVRSLTYTHPDCEKGVEAVWQWAVENKVTAEAKVGGAVSKSEEWVAFGEVFTVTATADAANGFSFYRWTDANGATVSREATLTVKVDEPMSLTAEFAGTFYVDAENGNDETGDGLVANPYATLQKALSVAADGSTVLLQDGTYLMDDPFTTIARPITIKSVNGPANCSLTKGTTYADQYKRGIIELNHEDAVVDGVTLCNGYFYSRSPGSPVMVTKGVVRNCIISNNQGGSDGSGNHGGVTVNGGTLRDCVVRGNWAAYNNGGTGVGGGVYLSSGLVEGCVITNNAAGINGAGVYMTGADSVLRNCFVAYNHGLYIANTTAKAQKGGGVYVANGLVDRCTVRGNYASDGAGVYLAGGKILNSLVLKNHGTNAGAGIRNDGGTVVNCTVADNEANGTTKGTGFYQSKGVTQNTVIYGNPCGVDGDATVSAGTFDHNFTMLAIAGYGDNAHGNVFYKNAANEDYTLLAGSKAIDGAVAYDGVETDLAGTVRPQGAAPDMGCYEYLSGQGPLSCSFNAPDVTLFLEEGEATFVASADGANLDGLSYAWYFNGVLQEGETGSTINWASIPRGAHTVKLVVRNGADETAECELKDVIKVTTTHVYANETGSNTYPYDTAEKGANKLQDALDAVWVPETGVATVTVKPGTYKCWTRWFIINQPMVLESTDGPASTTLLAYNPDGGGFKRVINVNHPDAFVSGFTIKGGEWSNTNGDSGPGGLRLQAGVVTNCVITGNRGCWVGGGAQMSGGLLVDCDIHDNHSIYNNNSTDTYGGGIYMTGGTVDVCRVHNCWAGRSGDAGCGIWANAGVVRNSDIYGNWAHNTAAKGIGIVVGGSALIENCHITNNFTSGHVANDASGVYQTGGTMRNCLITGNKANNNGAGVYQTGGTMEFCTVVGNTSVNVKNSGLYLNGANAVNRYNIIYSNGKGVESEPKCNLDFQKAATFAKNIVAPVPEGTDNIAAAPGFKDAAAGDYTLGAGSPAIDAATDVDVDYLPFDLVYNARPKDGDGDGDAVCDLGCYEAPDASEGPLSCSFSPLESSGLDEVTVTFEASVSGGGSKGELHYAWDFGEGVLVSDTADAPDPTVRFSTYGSHTVSLTVTAEGGKTATKTVPNCVRVGAATIYVNAANETPAWPYNTWETAATNLTEAFNSIILANGSVPKFVLTNGTYRVEQKAFILSFPVRFTSVEGPEKTIVQAANPDSDNKSVFWVENADALVDGLTMTGAYWDGWDAGGASALRLSAGVVSNCVIRNSSAGRSSYGAVQVNGTGLLTHSVIRSCSCDSSSSSGASQHGGGLAIWGDGVVAHTVVSNCYSTSISYDCAGGGVYQYGGTLRDSQVLDCYVSGKNYQGAAIWQAGGLCERCVFGDTKHKDAYGAAVYLTGGTNRNNLVRGAWTSKGAAQALQMTGGWFWNNTVVTNGWGSTQASPVAANVTGGEVKNCLFACNNGADVSDANGKVSFSRFAEADGTRDNTAADPAFRDLIRHPWILSGSSPCVNKGDKSVWAGETNPTDFLGQPRIKSRKVDMGCYECQIGGFSLIVR